MSAAAVRLGRATAVVGPPALLVLTAGWLFLDAGALRTAVLWTALTALAACVLALAGHLLWTGRVTPARGYELALYAGRTPAPGAGAAVPAQLHPSRWPWARVGALALAVPTALVLFGTLGAGDPDRDPAAARIADAGYVIKELPVVAVRNVERAGPSRRASSTADYTVRLPAPDDGKGVSATFRTEVSRGVREVGDLFPVAYAPQWPELGAIGATAPSTIEARLAGRTLSYGNAAVVAVLWALCAVAAVGAGAAVTGPPRRRRRVDERWVALRATVAGVAEHVERPSDDAAGAGAEKSAPRYECLTLRTEDGEVPLRLAASHKRAAPLLTGAEGWLLWNPAGVKGKVAADFVLDDGGQLPGRLPGAEATRIAAARPRGSFPIDAGRPTRPLELGSHWARTVPAGALVGAIGSVAAAGALLLPAEGGWRTWTAVAGALAPLVGWLVSALGAAPEAKAAPVRTDPAA